MKGRSKMIPGLAIMALLPWIAGLPVMAQAEQEWVHGDDYQPGDFGRVKYLENGVSIVRAAADPGMPPQEDAGLNAPVFPGDMLQTGFDQRVEIELASGSVVRVDRATDVAFLALPDPYLEFADNTVLQLAEGTIQTTAFLGDGEEFRVDTPTASIYLLGDGDFRIEVDPQGRTRVISTRGVAEVVGEGGSVLVRGGMLSEVYAGSFPLSPTPFNTFNTDTFDRWVDDRESIYLVGDRYHGEAEYGTEVYDELPDEVQPYYRELSNQGDWVYTDDYGYVWYPSEVSSEWRPYRDGYWDYGPDGYFWVSHEPWGWAPYHYGRWDWVGGYGWVWVPGRVFAGAWVAWSWGSVHVGWAPLSYWNTPVYVGPVYYNYYSSHCWTFISYDHIAYRDYNRYAVPLERVGDDLRRTAVLTRPPRVSPRQLSESPDWRQRAVRNASTDSAAQIKNPYRDRRSTQNMRDVESSLRRRNAVNRGAGAAGDTTASRPRSQRRAMGQRTDRTDRTNGSSNASRTKTSFPRRGTSTEQPRARPDNRAGGTARPSAPSRHVNDRSGSTSNHARPQRTTFNESADRVRNLYRSMASPRTTRERSGNSPGPARTERTPSRTGPSRVERTPSRSSPTRRSTNPSRAAPPRTTSTVPRSAPSRPSSARTGGAKSGAKSGARPGSSPRKSPNPAARSGSSSARPRTGGAKSGAKSGARPGSSPRKSSNPAARSGSSSSRPRSGGARPSAKSSSSSRPRSASPSGSRSAPRSSGSRSGSGSKSSGSPSKSSGSRSKAGRKR